MKPVHVGCAALNQIPLDWKGNTERIQRAIAAARATGVRVLCLPELAITGYGCEDAFHAPHVATTAWAYLTEIAGATDGMIVSVGLPVEHRGTVFDACALIVDGTIAGLVCKRFLAGDGIHYEPRWFKPWPSGVVDLYEAHSLRIPIGDLVFECGDLRIGFEICEEAWVPNRPGANLAFAGVDIILNPSASHFAFGKSEVRRRFVIEGSRAFSAAYLYANLLGNEAGRIIYDGGCLVASEGRLVAQGRRFSFEDVELTNVIVDVELNRLQRTRSGSFVPQLGLDDPSCVRLAFEPKAAPFGGAPAVIATAPWESSDHMKEEEFTRAIALGLFDYVRKSRSHGFVVSLSGGIDSAAVLSLAAFAIEQAVSELGLDGVKSRLAYAPAIQGCASAKELVQSLVSAVYQATANSSTTTRDAAAAVARETGAMFFEWNVEQIVQSYVSLVSASIGRALAWDSDDVSLQNIQARVRAPGVWLLANIRGALLLSTSNRSEAAVGYATMDGDTCGGLSPIAGIDKAFLTQWVRWMAAEGPFGGRALAGLLAVTSLPPTAELKPASYCQTDEKDLMPYDVLDAIERAAVRDRRSPEEALATVTGIFPHHSPEDLKLWVKRFFNLWCRNQWKRERYAPSFHVDDQSLDPRTWCRFPILSSGFAEELAKL